MNLFYIVRDFYHFKGIFQINFGAHNIYLCLFIQLLLQQHQYYFFFSIISAPNAQKLSVTINHIFIIPLPQHPLHLFSINLDRSKSFKTSHHQQITYSPSLFTTFSNLCFHDEFFFFTFLL